MSQKSDLQDIVWGLEADVQNLKNDVYALEAEVAKILKLLKERDEKAAQL